MDKRKFYLKKNSMNNTAVIAVKYYHSSSIGVLHIEFYDYSDSGHNVSGDLLCFEQNNQPYHLPLVNPFNRRVWSNDAVVF